jgi:hypothetical protein
MSLPSGPGWHYIEPQQSLLPSVADRGRALPLSPGIAAECRPRDTRRWSGVRHSPSSRDKFDLITADFTYVRWLGDRKGIEEKTTTWDKVIVDRQGDLFECVSLLKKVQERRIMILALANNHYALDMALRLSRYSAGSGVMMCSRNRRVYSEPNSKPRSLISELSPIKYLLPTIVHVCPAETCHH